MTSPPLHLRPFGLFDAAQVASWLDGPGVSVPKGAAGRGWASRMLANPRVHAWVAVQNFVAVAFVRLDIGPDRVAELTIGVDGARRRQGTGRAVLELLLAQARKLRVRRLQAVVDVANTAALAFFAESGFEETGSRTGARLFVRWMHEAGREVLEIEG